MIIGGLVLVAIGAKILVEHLLGDSPRPFGRAVFAAGRPDNY